MSVRVHRLWMAVVLTVPEILANQVIHPDDIQVQFEDVGGLDNIVEELRESVIYPLVYPNLFEEVGLVGAPKGQFLQRICSSSDTR
jgi:ATP-dependent 26S proteasome regulatory subunit